MRKVLLMICMGILGSHVFFPVPMVHAEGFNIDFSGVLYEQPSYFDVDGGNVTNPDNEIFDFSEWANRFYGRVNLNLYYNKIRFISQTRPTLFSNNDGTEFDFYADDAYLDLQIVDGYFLYAGRKNVRDVVAYGANPTDFLGENKEVDYTKREEDRRIEREGNYVVGGEIFLNNATLGIVYAPRIDDIQDEKDRAYVRGNFFAEPINTDMSLHLFNGEIPGVGFDLTSTVGENLILHTENSVRWGSTKREISITSMGDDESPRIYSVTDPDDEDDVYPHVVIGGSYTFGDGTNIIAEYIYNGDGYSSNEWDEITDYFEYNSDAFTSMLFVDSARGNLLSSADLIKIREMRKNYVFLRLSNSSLIEKLSAQLVFFLNADDMSFLTFPSIDYSLSDNVVAGVSATLYTGAEDTEFGMMYWSKEATVALKYFF